MLAVDAWRDLTFAFVAFRSVMAAFSATSRCICVSAAWRAATFALVAFNSVTFAFCASMVSNSPSSACSAPMSAFAA